MVCARRAAIAGDRADVLVAFYQHSYENHRVSLRPGGVLLYETFADGNQTVGKPSRPDFLLRPGELIDVADRARLVVLAYEHGYVEQPKPAEG